MKVEAEKKWGNNKGLSGEWLREGRLVKRRWWLQKMKNDRKERSSVWLVYVGKESQALIQI